MPHDEKASNRKPTFKERFDKVHAESLKELNKPEFKRREYLQTWTGLLIMWYGLIFFIPTMIAIRHFGVPKEVGIGLSVIISIILATRGAVRRTNKKFKEKLGDQ